MWTKEQQAEHRKLWVDALRSDTYKQGVGVLRDFDDQFCCLGVACDLAIKAGVPGIKWETLFHPDGQRYSCYALKDDELGGTNTNIPTDTVKNWLGLSGEGGKFDDKSIPVSPYNLSLWKLNDQEKFDFKQIADVIEKEPQGLLA